MSEEDSNTIENEEETEETMNTEQEGRAEGEEQNATMRAARLARFGGEGVSRRVLQNVGDRNNDNDSDSEK